MTDPKDLISKGISENEAKKVCQCMSDETIERFVKIKMQWGRRRRLVSGRDWPEDRE